MRNMRDRPKRFAVNIFMLNAAATPIFGNSLMPNELQNVPFELPKQCVSEGETGHIACPNVPFHAAICSKLQTMMQENAFWLHICNYGGNADFHQNTWSIKETDAHTRPLPASRTWLAGPLPP